MPTTAYGDVKTLSPMAAQWLAADTHQYTFKLHPELWRIPEVEAYYRGRSWTKISFDEAKAKDVPDESGVYMFVAEPRMAALDDHSYIFYVGKATSLRARFKVYFKEMRCELDHNRKNVVKFLSHLNPYLFFHYTLIDTADIAKAEALLKDNIDPPANTQTEVIGRLTT